MEQQLPVISDFLSENLRSLICVRGFRVRHKCVDDYLDSGEQWFARWMEARELGTVCSASDHVQKGGRMQPFILLHMRLCGINECTVLSCIMEQDWSNVAAGLEYHYLLFAERESHEFVYVEIRITTEREREACSWKNGFGLFARDRTVPTLHLKSGRMACGALE